MASPREGSDRSAGAGSRQKRVGEKRRLSRHANVIIRIQVAGFENYFVLGIFYFSSAPRSTSASKNMILSSPTLFAVENGFGCVGLDSNNEMLILNLKGIEQDVILVTEVGYHCLTDGKDRVNKGPLAPLTSVK